jgi:hypothetical protein
MISLYWISLYLLSSYRCLCTKFNNALCCFAECHYSNVILLNVVKPCGVFLCLVSLYQCHYTECHLTECRFTECHYKNVTLLNVIIPMSLYWMSLFIVIIILMSYWVFYAGSLHIECCYAECRYTKCRYAECGGAIHSCFGLPSVFDWLTWHKTRNKPEENITKPFSKYYVLFSLNKVAKSTTN